jgi:hypothetical protein
LRTRQGIDDAAEQHRLGEACCGERHVGERENPAEPHLRAEQAEHADVEAEHGHGRHPEVRGRSPSLEGRPGTSP